MEPHDRAPDALTDLDGLLGGRAPQQDRELLAAVPGRRVLGAHARRDRARDRGEHPVPGGVPVAIVEPLEVVDVDHQDAEAVRRAPSRALDRQDLVEVAAVRAARSGRRSSRRARQPRARTRGRRPSRPPRPPSRAAGGQPRSTSRAAASRGAALRGTDRRPRADGRASGRGHTPSAPAGRSPRPPPGPRRPVSRSRRLRARRPRCRRWPICFAGGSIGCASGRR